MTGQKCNLTQNFSYCKLNCGEKERCFIDVKYLIVGKLLLLENCRKFKKIIENCKKFWKLNKKDLLIELILVISVDQLRTSMIRF